MKTFDHFYYNVQSAAVTYTNFLRLLVINRGAGGGGSGGGRGGLLELYFPDRRRH